MGRGDEAAECVFETVESHADSESLSPIVDVLAVTDVDASNDTLVEHSDDATNPIAETNYAIEDNDALDDETVLDEPSEELPTPIVLDDVTLPPEPAELPMLDSSKHDLETAEQIDTPELESSPPTSSDIVVDDDIANVTPDEVAAHTDPQAEVNVAEQTSDATTSCDIPDESPIVVSNYDPVITPFVVEVEADDEEAPGASTYNNLQDTLDANIEPPAASSVESDEGVAVAELVDFRLADTPHVAENDQATIDEDNTSTPALSPEDVDELVEVENANELDIQSPDTLYTTAETVDATVTEVTQQFPTPTTDDVLVAEHDSEEGDEAYVDESASYDDPDEAPIDWRQLNTAQALLNRTPIAAATGVAVAELVSQTSPEADGTSEIVDESTEEENLASPAADEPLVAANEADDIAGWQLAPPTAFEHAVIACTDNAEAAEPFRCLVDEVRLRNNFVLPASLMFCTARATERSGVTLAHMATLMAAQGEDILIVDANLAEQTLTRKYEAIGESGLCDILTGKMSPLHVIRVTARPHLFFLPCGDDITGISRDADQLSTNRLTTSLAIWKQHFHRILIDVGELSSTLFGGYADTVDAISLIVGHPRPDDELLEQACRELNEKQATLLGLVLTDWPEE
ncbi:MAG: hypothetical protein KDB23_04775, partial [Planctomycetales bacterium]|nr:hypothetical protein [Planctomycetales bacterium]